MKYIFILSLLSSMTSATATEQCENAASTFSKKYLISELKVLETEIQSQQTGKGSVLKDGPYQFVTYSTKYQLVNKKSYEILTMLSADCALAEILCFDLKTDELCN